MSGIWNLSTLCRCCHADGVFKSLVTPYKVDDNNVIYIEMLTNTLGLYLQSPRLDVSSTICDTCIGQLRKASQFKNQVLLCEEKFREYCNNELLQQVAVKIENDADVELVVKHEIVKTEDDHIDGECDNSTIEERDLESTHDSEENVENLIEREKDIEGKKTKIPVKSKPKRKLPLKINLKWCNRTKTETGFKYTCRKCTASFDVYGHLSRHINKKHVNNFRCKICKETFTEHNIYRNHYKKHTEKKKLYECEFCDKSYTNLPSFYYHTNTHLKKNKFICDICNKVFLHKTSLKKHLLWHMGLSKKIMCDVCGHPFNDITNMNKHKSAVHDKLRPFECTLCPKTFASPKNLLYHTRRHTGDRPFKCDLCQKAFITITILNKHKKTHDIKQQNGGPRVYKCKICSKIFDHKGLYLSHVRKHDVIRPFNCNLCAKGFCTQYTLNRHIESHEEIKKFPCKQCNASLSTKSLLKRHCQRVHDPNRPIQKRFTCDVCKMAVTDLEKHKRSHTNKRFQCEFCSRSYSERNTLQRHVKQSHGGAKFPCNVCGKVYVQKGSLKNHMKRAHKDVKNDEE